MYTPRTPGYSKRDAEARWRLPDRVFFACGACHILAAVFLDRYGTAATTALWLKPVAGHTGNHIVIATAEWVFDYHGYSDRAAFFTHTWRRARHYWPGWDATCQPLPRPVLTSETLSKTYDGLWLREPRQFLHDATPRAESFLDRFPPPAL